MLELPLSQVGKLSGKIQKLFIKLQIVKEFCTHQTALKMSKFLKEPTLRLMKLEKQMKYCKYSLCKKDDGKLHRQRCIGQDEAMTA